MSETRATLEVIAPTIDEAIEKGLAELGLPPNAVEVEVLDEGSRGLLGIGSRQARVRLSIKPQAIPEPEEEMDVILPDTPQVPVQPEELEGQPEADEDRPLVVARETITELLEKMSLKQDANRRLGKYSGGMKRRINLIMALVHDPEIAFLDEPTVAMDPQSRHAVWDFIRELNRRGKTIILTTHYMEEAEELCGRVGIIDHGKLIAVGQPKELMEMYKEKNLEDVFIHLTGRRIREE